MYKYSEIWLCQLSLYVFLSFYMITYVLWSFFEQCICLHIVKYVHGSLCMCLSFLASGVNGLLTKPVCVKSRALLQSLSHIPSLGPANKFGTRVPFAGMSGPKRTMHCSWMEWASGSWARVSSTQHGSALLSRQMAPILEQYFSFASTVNHHHPLRLC